MSSPILFCVTLANRGGTLLSQLAVGAFLSPETVGTWAVALGIATIALFFQASDFSRIPLQAGEARREVDAALARWLVVAWLFTSLALAIVAPGLAAASYAPLLALLALCPLRMQANRQLTSLSADAATGRLAWSTAAEGVVRTVVLVGAIVAGAGVWSFVLVEWCAVLVQLAVTHRPAGPAKTREIAAMDSAAAVVAGDSVAAVPVPAEVPVPAAGTIPAADLPARPGKWYLPPRTVRQLGSAVLICLLVAAEGNLVAILMAKAVSASAAGSYFFALRFANQIIVILYPLMILESLPRLIQVRDDRALYSEERRRMTRRYWSLAAAMGCAAAVVGPVALHLIWGERWSEAAQMLHVLGFTMIFRAMLVFAKVQLEALGAFHIILLISFCDLAAIIAIIVLCGMQGWPPLAMVAVLGVEALAVLLVAQAAAFRRSLAPSPVPLPAGAALAG